MKAVNILIEEKNEIIANFHAVKNTLYDTAVLDAEQTELQKELDVVAELVQQCVSENAHTVLDQMEYKKRYDRLIERLDRTKEQLVAFSQAIVQKQARRE